METTGRGVELSKEIMVESEGYRLVCFSPTRAIVLGAKLGKLILEPLAGMAGVAGGEDKLSETLMLCSRTLMKNMDANEVVNLIKELLTCVSQSNKLLNFDQHFQGRLGHMSKLIAEVIQYQFADFTAAIGQAVAELMEKARAA